MGTTPSRRADTAAALSSTRPAALASRAVTALAETSTMCAVPSDRTWVRPPVRSVCSGCGATSDLEVEQHDVDDVARVELRDVVGDDEEGVGLGEVTHEV